MQSAREEVRAQTAEGQHSASFQRIQSARQRRSSNAGPPPTDDKVIAFGRTQQKQTLMRRTGSFSGMPAKQDLTSADINKNALAQFDKQTKSKND